MDDSRTIQHEQLGTLPAQFANYAGVEGDDAALAEIRKRIDLGQLSAYDSNDALEAAVGGRPVLNKLGLVIKQRANVTSKRLILDTRESSVKDASCKSQWVIFPSFFWTRS